MLSRTSAALVLAISWVCVRPLSAQAHITENQTVYIYVDANSGYDGNSGSQYWPLKTIQAAVNEADALNQQGVGVMVIVNPGIYRESVEIGNYYATGATLTVQAAVKGTAAITGSDVLTGWNQAGATYDRSWTLYTTSCGIPSGWPTNFAPIGLSNEMVFVNGIPLTQVMAFNDMKPGTFFINSYYSLIHIYPPTGTNMQAAVVEAATRPKTLSVENRQNVVIRGLVFEHAANCLNTSSAMVSSSANVLIDSVQAIWNNWGGLGVFSSDYVTVQSSTGSYNGGVGFQGTRDQNILFDSNETDFDNWRGAQAGLYDWASGGAKLFQMRTTTVNNHISYNNQAQGLWFDTDNKTITINHATLAGNLLAALQTERNEGPITLENSVLCSSGQGINVLTSEQLTIQNNTFYNNGGTNINQAEIFLGGRAGGFYLYDWQTGQPYDLFTTDMVLTGNTFEDASSGQNVFGTYLGPSDWYDFTSTLYAADNKWYDPFTSTSFKLLYGQLVSLWGWQNATGTDYTSSWGPPATSPASACAIPLPSYDDFTLSADSRGYTMSSAGVAVVTARVNSFGYGTVYLQASGLPPGVTANFSRTSLQSGVATLTLTASSGAVEQTVPITLWATSGSRVHTVTFYVQVGSGANYYP